MKNTFQEHWPQTATSIFRYVLDTNFLVGISEFNVEDCKCNKGLFLFNQKLSFKTNHKQRGRFFHVFPIFGVIERII